MRIRWRGFELPTHVMLEKETATDRYGKFAAEPFERGYGVTVGNSLRRVLATLGLERRARDVTPSLDEYARIVREREGAAA